MGVGSYTGWSLKIGIRISEERIFSQVVRWKERVLFLKNSKGAGVI